MKLKLSWAHVYSLINAVDQLFSQLGLVTLSKNVNASVNYALYDVLLPNLLRLNFNFIACVELRMCRYFRF